MPINLDLLMRAYANGIFPMSDARDDPDTFWIEPEQRAILPLDGFRLSKSLAKTIRQDRFVVTADTAFARVIATCAESREDRRDTWINSDIEDAFCALHRMGQAHSVECWLDEDLVGGLYGLAMGRAFFWRKHVFQSDRCVEGRAIVAGGAHEDRRVRIVRLSIHDRPFGQPWGY